MSKALFEKIIDNLAEMGFGGTILFGLYGEPLQDPQFPARIDYIRKTLPAVAIGLSTNAAVYEWAKHQDALARIDFMAVHIEAMSPDIYARAMKPLKVHRTFPRAEQILADNPGRVHKSAKRAATIYGPYRRLSPGRYSVTFDISEGLVGAASDLTLEVVSATGVILASDRRRGASALETTTLAVEIDDFGKLEFRIQARGLDGLFTGVQVARLDEAKPTSFVRSGVERAFGEPVLLTD